MAMIPITRPSRRPHELPRAILDLRVRGKVAPGSKHDPHRLSQAALRIEGHTAPFRGSAIVPTRLSFLSRALKRCLPLYTWAFIKWTTLPHRALCGHRGRPIHPSAWEKVHSEKSRCRILHLHATVQYQTLQVGFPGTPHSPGPLPMGALDSNPCVRCYS